MRRIITIIGEGDYAVVERTIIGEGDYAVVERTIIGECDYAGDIIRYYI
jgi:hypothetical protein